MISLTAVSDVHNRWDELIPALENGGDILVIAGDLTEIVTYDELLLAVKNIASYPFTFKIAIAGNHDIVLAHMAKVHARQFFEDFGIIYLEGESTSLLIESETVKIYGTPWTPRYGNFVFQDHDKQLEYQ